MVCTKWQKYSVHGPTDRYSRCHHGDFSEDDTPVMGSGHCPIYDAACIGDWSRVIALCKPCAVDENLDPELTHDAVDCDAKGEHSLMNDAEEKQ